MDSTRVAERAVNRWVRENDEWLGRVPDRFVFYASTPDQLDVEVYSGVLAHQFAVMKFYFMKDDRDGVDVLKVTVQDQLDRFARFADALGPVRGWDGCWSHAS